MNHTLPHVACFSCGKRIGAYEDKFNRLVESGLTRGEALDQLGITRVCCRTNMLSPAVLPLGAGVKLREEQKAVKISAPAQAIKETPRREGIPQTKTPARFASSRTPTTIPQTPSLRGRPSPLPRLGNSRNIY